MERFLKRGLETQSRSSSSAASAKGDSHSEIDHLIEQDTETQSHAAGDGEIEKEAGPKKKPRTFKFGEGWKVGRPWLLYKEGKMFCTYCKDYNNPSTGRKNTFALGCKSFRLENVRAHEISNDHKVSHTAFLNSRKTRIELPIVRAVVNLEVNELEQMRKLFTTAFYIAKQEKPFTDFVSLIELQSKNFPEGTKLNHYISDKQAREFIHHIAAAELQEKLELIRQSEFISVALDGATDSANMEEESFFVSYLDKDCEPHVDFIKMSSVESRATAQGLTDCFFQTFSDLGIEVKRDCIQLTTDGPSVMKNMCKLIKNDIKWVLQCHCVNHRLELAFKDAVRNVSLQSDVHELLDGLHHFYDNSSLQSRMLRDTANLLGIKSVVHPVAKGTRWVAHRERAIAAVDRNYIATVAQLQECNMDQSQRTETRAKALGLKEKLQDENIVIFMFAILKVLLAVFSSLSCLLQSDDVSIDTLTTTVSRAKQKMLQFDSGERISEFRQTQIDNGAFRDVQLKIKKTGGRNVATQNIVKKQSDELVAALKQAISTRLGELGDGNNGLCPEIALFSVFDVSKLPDCEGDDINLYGKEEIRELTKHFSELLIAKGYDPEQIEDERAALFAYTKNALKTTTKDGRTIKKFWPKIVRKKGDSTDVRNILALVKILLVLLFSTACVERGFSMMKRIKSDWRSKLKQQTLTELMLLSLSETTVSTFNPDPAIKLWWLKAKKPRRLVDAYGPRPSTSTTQTAASFVVDTVVESDDMDSDK